MNRDQPTPKPKRRRPPPKWQVGYETVTLLLAMEELAVHLRAGGKVH